MDIKVTNLGVFREKLTGLIKRNRVLVLALLLGVLLLVFAGRGRNTVKKEEKQAVSVPEFSLAEEEKKLSEALSQLDGAGRVEVILTLKSSVSQQLAENSRGSSRADGESSDSDTDKTVVTLSTGSGLQSAVPVKYFYPDYQGALVLCDGAGNTDVRLKITQAVSSLTGLGSDKITVVKMKKTGGQS